MRFDLTDLRLFLAVVEAGSITHGAAEAGLSLPAASERLRDMEIAGGIGLLERGRRGVKPTQAGDALAHHARLILDQMSRLRGELGEHAQGLRATIRLLANTAALTEILPARLGPWLAAHPRIDLDLRERQSAEIAAAIAGGLAEIGILSDAVETGSLTLRPFAIDRLVVVAPDGHPVADEKRIGFAAVLDHGHVGLAGGALRDHIEARAAGLGRRLKIRVRVPGFDGVCRLVADGVGLGIVPETAALRARRRLPIRVIPLAEPWATRRLSLCFRSEDALSPAARDLARHLATPDG